MHRSNATEVSINYASGICICIDFNKSYFLRASFCTCCRIAGVLPDTTHALVLSSTPDFQLGGNETKKGIIKIIIESPLIVGVQALFFSRWATLEEFAGTVEER